MIRRVIAMVLTFSILLTLLPAMSLPAAAEGPEPTVDTMYYEAWQGLYPAVGDDGFYIFCEGSNLAGLHAVAYVVNNNNERIQVATQVDSRMMGQTTEGKERMICRMSMDGGGSLDAQDIYYLHMEDADQTSYYETSFNAAAYPYYAPCQTVQPNEISSGTSEIPLEVIAYGFAPDLAADDFMVELVHVTGFDFNTSELRQESPEHTPLVVGTMGNIALSHYQDGGYQLKGTVTFNGSLAPDQTLYARVTAKGAHIDGDFTKYSNASPTYVINGALRTPGQFVIQNSVVCQSGGGGHEYMSGVSYLKAGPSVTFTCGAADTAFYFDLSGTLLSDPSKLSATLGGSSVVLSNLSATGTKYAVHSISGSLEAGAALTGTLIFYYDGALLFSTQLNRAAGGGERGVSVYPQIGDDLYSYALPPLAAGESFPVTVGYPMNLDLGQSKFTAYLQDGNSNRTDLNVAEQIEKGRLTLSLSASGDLLGEYTLYLLYDGGPLPTCQYYGFDGTVQYDAYSANPITFGKTGVTAYLSSAEMQNGGLLLKGGGFSASSYTVHLIPRGGADLHPTELTAAESAQRTSGTSLTLSSTALSGIPLGWYTVFLTDENGLVSGLTNVTLLPADSGELIAPTARINEDVVTTPDVTLTITMGDYIRVKVSQSGEAAVPDWSSNPPTSFILAGEFGTKTLHFLFEASDGSTVTLSDTVDYRSSSLAALGSFGAAGAAEPQTEGGSWTLNKGSAYNLYFTHGDPALAGIVTFLDESGNTLGTETLYRTSGQAPSYTYSKRVNFSGALEGTKQITFQASDRTGVSHTAVETLSVIVSETAVIRSRNVSFQTAWSSDYVRRAVQGSSVSYRLSGTPGFSAKATLNYETADETPKNQDISLTEGASAGTYSAEAALPSDCAKVVRVDFTLTDPANPTVNQAEESTPYEMGVTAAVEFTGLDNADGKYDGMYLKVDCQSTGDYRMVGIGHNQTAFTLSDLIPDQEYSYSILKYDAVYTSGSLAAAAAGAKQTVSLANGVKTPAKVTFHLPDGLPVEWAEISFQTENGLYHYTRPGWELDGFYVGQSITHRLTLSSNDLRKYQLPEEGTASVDSGNVTVDVPLVPLETQTVTGTVTDKLLTGHPALEGVSVRATQIVTNGGISFLHSTSAETGSDGAYSLELYDGVPASIICSKKGYVMMEEAVTPGVDAGETASHDVEMSYETTNRIRVTLGVLPLDDGSEEALEPVITSPYGISLSSLTGLAGTGAYFSGGYIYLPGTVQDNANKTVQVEFRSGTLQFPEGYRQYQVELDGYGSGSVQVTAQQRGVITGEVLSSGENPPPAYMLVFNASGYQVGNMISGEGVLSFDRFHLDEGSYTVLFLRGYDLSRITNFRSLEDWNAIGLEENVHYVKQTVQVQNGKLTDCGRIDLPQPVTNKMLGAFQVRMEAEYVPDGGNGTVRVSARIEPEFTGLSREITLQRISWSLDGEYSTSRAYLDGGEEAITSSYRSFFTAEEQSKLAHTLLITIAPKDGQQEVSGYLYLQYQINGKNFSEITSVKIPAARLTLEVPMEVTQGEKAKAVTLFGQAPNGSTVEIYEDGEPAGSVQVFWGNRYSVQLSLSRPEEPGVRAFTAKTTHGGVEYVTEEQFVEVLDTSRSAWASQIEFLQYPHGGDEQPDSRKTYFCLDDPDNPIYDSDRFYNPNRAVTVTFRINNLLKADIESAQLVKSYRGVETPYEATWVGDVTGASPTYSEWQYQGLLGYIDDLYVQFSLKDVAGHMSALTGTETPDFAAAVGLTTPDPAQAPSFIRDGAVTAQDNTDPNYYHLEMNLSDGGTLDYTAQFTPAVTNVTVAQLLADNYREMETRQGKYWVKDTLTPQQSASGTVNLTLERKMYFDPALTAILNPAPAGRMSVMGRMSTRSSTDTVLGYIEMTGNVQNASEIVYQSVKGAPADLGRFGTAMNVVGGVALAVNIFRGRTTKDAQTLYDAVRLIKDVNVRNAIRREISDYSGLTVSHYAVSNVFNGVGYVSGFGGPLGKGLSLVCSFGGGWYNGATGSELNLMWESIMRSILTQLQLEDMRAAKKKKLKKVNWLLDPSGYVFEAVEGNRVQDVTAEVYSSSSENGIYSVWGDAADSGQENPQSTDVEGRYGWDVPEGFWKVKFNDDGGDYQPAESKTMAVPPMHDQVNIGLLATRAPAIAAAAANTGGLELEFDTFVQADSVYDADAHVMNVQVFDHADNPVPLDRVEFVIAADNTGYAPDMTYQKDVVGADRFVKRIRLIAAEAEYPGGFPIYQDDGQTAETYRVVVSANMRSYAGVCPDAELTQTGLQVTDRDTAAVPAASLAEGRYDLPQTVTLSTATEGATIYYTIDGTTPTTLSRVYKGAFDVEESCELQLIASKVGMEDSEIASLRYFIGPDAPNVAATPTASPAAGTYSSAQTVALTSATENAIIYYTTDHSRPGTGSTRYTSPISVSQSMTIRALAVRDGYADSGVATFTYTIQAGQTGGTVGTQTGGGGGSQTSETPVTIKNADGTVSSFSAVVTQTDSGVRVAVEGSRFGTAGQGSSSIKVNAGLSIITFDAAAAGHIGALAGAGTVEVTVETVAADALTQEQRTLVGGRPVYDLTVTAGGERVSDFGGGTARVSIPYTLGAGEAPNSIVVWYLSDSGTLEAVRGRYDADTGTVEFQTGHFSKYVIASNPVSFPDVAESAWYRPAVDFLAAREITTGTDQGLFQPDAKPTRAQFIVILMRGLCIKPAVETTGNFDDAGDTYYTAYLMEAKRLGITTGVGDNLFLPDRVITRQEMFVMLCQALRALSELPEATSGKNLSDYSDGGEIAAWARDSMETLVQGGVISGSGGRLMPENTATRAEMAQIIYNLLAR